MEMMVYFFNIYGKTFMIKSDKPEEYISAYIYKYILKKYKRNVKLNFFMAIPYNKELDLTFLTKKYKEIKISNNIKLSEKDINNGLNVLKNLTCVSISNKTKWRYENV